MTKAERSTLFCDAQDKLRTRYENAALELGRTITYLHEYGPVTERDLERLRPTISVVASYRRMWLDSTYNEASRTSLNRGH